MFPFHPRQIFYRFLRPHAVASGEALSSDAFSAFASCAACVTPTNAQPCAHTSVDDNDRVTVSTFDAVSAVVQLAAQIERRELVPTDGAFLVDEMHAAGANLRHMGSLRYNIKIPFVRTMLLIEMVSRVVRVELQARLHRALLSASREGAVAACFCVFCFFS